MKKETKNGHQISKVMASVERNASVANYPLKMRFLICPFREKYLKTTNRTAILTLKAANNLKRLQIKSFSTTKTAAVSKLYSAVRNLAAERQQD
ncbi:hypothetical protein HPP92_017889 [Vanilla planifolia]|uniref:Uncharacterized protein n=1 Tax=Vanilla planifolia TaxID=51239 RepID=A0A835Q620_VANPL|nr:hypothetical protein HPP92_017889 [Vanilla planifolia]